MSSLLWAGSEFLSASVCFTPLQLEERVTRRNERKLITLRKLTPDTEIHRWFLISLALFPDESSSQLCWLFQTRQFPVFWWRWRDSLMMRVLRCGIIALCNIIPELSPWLQADSGGNMWLPGPSSWPGRRETESCCPLLVINYQWICCSALRVKTLMSDQGRGGGSNDATARQSQYYFSLLGSDLYCVSPERREVVTSQCGRALCLPEWAAGPRRLELDWSHWAESRVLWGNSSFVLHAPLMMNEITRFYSRRKKRKLSSYFKLYHCIRIVLLLFKT